MRRALQKTLSRSIQAASRPVASPALAKRYESSSSSSASPNKPSTDPSSSSSSTAIAERRIPLLITEPVPIHPSAPSNLRTRPLKSVLRKKMWPRHPRFAENVHNDERLFDLDLPTEVRMPHNREIDFDLLRRKGFFPGDPKITRTHYMEAYRAWKSRVRGEVGQVYSRSYGKWIDSNRMAFYVRYCKEHNLPIDYAAPHADFLRNFTLEEYFLVNGGKKLEITVDDMNPDATKEHLGFDPSAEGVQVNFDDPNVPYFSRPMDGKVPSEAEEGEAVPYESEHIDKEALSTHLDKLFKWDNIHARYNGFEEEERFDLAPVRLQNVGYQVFLPNIVVRMIRNNVKPGESYDPWIATFRVPPSMTKTDLRSYLKAVYNLDVTFIRTDIRWGKVVRDRVGRKMRAKGSQRNHKRAVVGLHQPFHYPDDAEELRALGRSVGMGDKLYEPRVKALEQMFYLEANQEYRRKAIQMIYKRATEKYRAKGTNSNRGTVARILLEKKRAREAAIDSAAKALRYPQQA